MRTTSALMGCISLTIAISGCGPVPSGADGLARNGAESAAAVDANPGRGDMAVTCEVPSDQWSCRGEIPVSECPADWAVLDKTVQCNICRYYVGAVAGLLTKYTNCNPRGNGGGVSCFYDAGTGKLAGAVQLTDVPIYCSGSPMQLSGSVTAEIARQADGLATPKCEEDAGTD